MVDLKPCPFCGGAASKSAYDRGIDIGCKACGYSRHFPGLLQTTPNDKPVAQYKNGAGGITEIPASEVTEFYHSDANERAADAWNNRAEGTQEAPEEAQDAALFRQIVELGIQFHSEGRRGSEDEAVWADDVMLWTEGDRLAAARNAVKQAAFNRINTPGGAA